MPQPLHYVCKEGQLVILIQRRHVKFIELFFPVQILLLFLPFQHQIFVCSVSSSLPPTHHMSVFIIPLLFSLVVHVEIVLVIVAFLPRFTKSPNQLRNDLQNRSHQPLVSKQLIVQDVG